MSKAFFYKTIGFSIIVLLVEIFGLHIAIMGMTDGKIFTTFKTSELPPVFLLEMALFVGVVLLLHFLVLAYAWLSAHASLATLKIQHQAAENFGLIVMAMLWAAIFLLNNAFIGRSAFSYWGEFSLGPINQTNFALLVAALTLLPLPLIIWWVIKSMGKRTAMTLTAGIALCTLLIVPAIQSKNVRASFSKPNVIVIGIDSFRPEYLRSKNIMPELNTLLADAAVFPEVYTPLARTFPSWTSMLSGLHPVETGARINLMDPELVRRDTMMTWPLRDAGYHTMLATDERRFSNLDESYGFDTVFGPAAGATDFVLGLAGDFPLVNLLASTDLGAYLFPYLSNNRAVKRLYRPSVFAERLGHELGKQPDKPLFLVTHLCLPHWPYEWADSPSAITTSVDSASARENKADAILQTRKKVYETAISAVDGQLKILLDSLRTSGHLDNAIVVVLTDHGEAIGWPEDLLVDRDDQTMPRSTKIEVGHGSNLFSLVQQQTFMAFKRYGGYPYREGDRRQRFFSYDLQPTLLDLLDLSAQDAVRGISMVPWLEEPGLDQIDRSLFVETGFYLPALNDLNIKITDVVSQGGSYYLINDDAKLIINPSEMGKLISGKQRGVLRGSKLLAQVPTQANDKVMQYEWLLADINDKQAVKLEPENFTSECDKQCIDMLAELLEFYGDELALEEWPVYMNYIRAIKIADNTSM
jgi:arylsulfatase A-like enzyme